MRNFNTTSVTTTFANVTGTVRNVVTVTRTIILRALSNAQFLIKWLAKPLAYELVAVRVYRQRQSEGRMRPMSARMDNRHSHMLGRQGGSWSGSDVSGF